MPYDPFAEFQKYAAMAGQTRAATPDPGRAINAGIQAGSQLRKTYDTQIAQADAAKNAAVVAQAKQAYAPGVGDTNAQMQKEYDAQQAPKPAPVPDGPAPGQMPAYAATPQFAALDAAYNKQGADVAPRGQLGGATPARELGPAPAPYPVAPPPVAPQGPVARPAQLPVPAQQPTPAPAGPPAPPVGPPPAPAPLANQDSMLPPDWRYIQHQY